MEWWEREWYPYSAGTVKVTAVDMMIWDQRGNPNGQCTNVVQKLLDSMRSRLEGTRNIRTLQNYLFP